METVAGAIPLVLLWTLVVIPAWRILSRLGFSPWWSLLAFVPVVNLVALWRLAFIKWPSTGKD